MLRSATLRACRASKIPKVPRYFQLNSPIGSNSVSLSAKAWRAFSMSRAALSEGRLNSLDTFTDEELMLQESGEPPSYTSDDEA